MKKISILLLSGLITISFIQASDGEKKQSSQQSQINTDKNVDWLMPVGFKKLNGSIPESFKNIQSDLDYHEIPNRSPVFNVERNIRDCEGSWPYCQLSYMNESDSYYYLSSGAEGDTFAVVFQPECPCVVQEVYVQWFTAGEVIAFGADYGNASEISPNGDCYDIPNGSTNLSPIGELRTNPTLNTIDGYNADWSTAGLLDIGGTFHVSSNPSQFVIALVKGGDTPQPLSNNNDITGREETYTWFGGPWNDEDDGTWGNYSPVIDLMMMVAVQYPQNGFLWANSYSLSNTYATTDTRTIEVDLWDDADCNGNGIGIGDGDVIILHIEVNGVEYANLDFDLAYAIDIDEYNNGLYGWDVAYIAEAGDVISYWVSAIDDNGLMSEYSSRSFEIIAPVNPDADLLIIDDSGNSYQIGYNLAAEQYGIPYEIWNVNSNNGIDWSVINQGWSNILVYGWGNSTLPVIGNEEDAGYSDFITNGGNLMLVDQDWFFGHNLDGYPNSILTVGPGDPAYDWFGIHGVLDNPYDADNYDEGCIGDTSFISLLYGLPDLNLYHSIYGSANWAGFIETGFAEPVYQGQSTGEFGGVRVDNGTNKTALFTLMADAAVDSTDDGDIFYVPEFFQFVNFFLDWFEVDGPPLISNISGPSGSIFSSEPQEITAEVSESNGDVFTVNLEYSTNDGETWTSISMSGESGIFSAFIPYLPGGTNVDYRVSATDEDGTTTTDGGSYFVYAPSNDILWVFNNEMNGVGFPDAYYFYEGNETGEFLYSTDIWHGGVSQELLSYYDIVMEITTTATWADLIDHYDVIHDWLNTGGKRYFLAGDEVLGIMTGWNDGLTVDGSLFNAMGIAEIYHDINEGSTTSVLNAIEGDILSGDMYEAVPDGSSIMYDPDYEIGFDNLLDGILPTDDATVFLTDQISEFAVGIYKEWDNTSRSVFCAFDPLSLNSAPEYYWFGASYVGPTIMSAGWVTCPFVLSGDVTDDGNVDVLDVVAIIGHILGNSQLTGCALLAADLNQDEIIDVMDIVELIWRFFPLIPRDNEIANIASLNVINNQVTFQSDGIVDAFQITISHEPESTIELTEKSLAADYVTDGSLTTMIIVAPETNELFSASGDFEFVDILAASSENYVDVSMAIPESFALKSAYPNPFNPITTIAYDVPVPSDVKVIIYDLLGRQLTELVNNYVEGGSYIVNWDASEFSSGVYLVRMTADDFISTQKVMLVK
ncbi:MAG: T9SS type A sorting domain-containing protein [Candidatus Marinimicrobia bacterium]|nr:T9SS type A sorting domain-containing protein [Candidatus Neomarinimicrobiota bacterium]